MNQTEHIDTHGEVYPAGDAVEHPHPAGSQYVKIAIILAVITAIEVGLYYVDAYTDFHRGSMVTSLIVLSIAKFALVVLYFMHLKFDNRIFTAFFAGGMVVTIVAFIAVLAMFRAL